MKYGLCSNVVLILDGLSVRYFQLEYLYILNIEIKVEAFVMFRMRGVYVNSLCIYDT